MNPYQYLNSNNGQLTDTTSNQKLDDYLHSLMQGVTVNPYNQSTDEYGNQTSNYEVNGIGQATKVGDNRYSIDVDDPSSRGFFNVNVEVDPLTNKVNRLGTTYGSHKAFDYATPAMFAALVAGGLLAAPYLGGAAVLGGAEAAAAGAEAGTMIAGDAFLPGALSTEAGDAFLPGALSTEAGDAFLPGALSTEAGDAGVASTTGAAPTGVVQLGNGTAYAPGATTNPLNPFYGTAQTSPTSLGLVSGGGGATMGEGSIIGSGVGLGQTVPASVFNVANALNMPRIPSQQSAQQKKSTSMANALRTPSNLDTSVSTYQQKDPFNFVKQQDLANILRG